jgi:hypothetical protein
MVIVATALILNLFLGQWRAASAEASGLMRCEVTNEVRVKGTLTIDTFGKPIAVKIDTFHEPLRVDVKK